MAELAKRAWATTSGGVTHSAKLYTTLGEVQNQGAPFVVDNVQCYAKYGATNDSLATKMLFTNSGGGAAALLSTAQLPYGYVEYASSGTFYVPAGCTRVRITACSGGGGSGSTLVGPNNSTVAPGGRGGYGASVNQRYINVTPTVAYGVTIGGGGAGYGRIYGPGNNGNNGGSGGNTYFGNLLGLAGGGGGTYGFFFLPVRPSNIHPGTAGATASPREIQIGGYGVGGNEGWGTGGYMKVEWGGGI